MNREKILAWLKKSINLEAVNDLFHKNVKRPQQHIKNYLTIFCDCVFLWLLSCGLIGYFIGEEMNSFSWWDKHKVSLILLLLFLAMTLKYDFYRNRWRFFFKDHLLSAIIINAYVTILFIPCFLLVNVSMGLPWSFPIALFTSLNAYILISRLLGNYFWYFVVEKKQWVFRHNVIMLIDSDKDAVFKLQLISKKYPKSNISVCFFFDKLKNKSLHKKIAEMGVSLLNYRLFESLYSGWMSSNSTIILDQNSIFSFQEKLLGIVDAVISYETLVLESSDKSFRLRKISYQDLIGGQISLDNNPGVKSLAIVSDSPIMINEIIYQTKNSSVSKLVIVSNNKELLYEHGNNNIDKAEIYYIPRNIISNSSDYFYQLLKFYKVDKLIMDNRLPNCDLDGVASFFRFFLEPKTILDGLSKATDIVIISDYKQSEAMLPSILFDYYLRQFKTSRILSVKVDNIFLAKENFSGLIKNCIIYNDIYTSSDLSKEGGLRLVTCRDLIAEILNFDKYKRGYSTYAFKGKFFSPMLITKIVLTQLKGVVASIDIDKIFENYKPENTDLGEAIVMEDSIKNVERSGFYELKTTSEKKINWEEFMESLNKIKINTVYEKQAFYANLLKETLKIKEYK